MSASPPWKGFKEKLLRLAEVLGVKNPGRNLAEVLERALDLALERKDPQRQNERRQERERRRLESTDEPSRPGESGTPPASVPSVPSASPPACGPKQTEESRHIPLAVRGRVLERASYQCEFTGPDGTRCPSRTGLEIEHRRPFAIFHSHDEFGLEALCQAHNRYRAERTYGAGFIRRKIEERRSRLTAAGAGRCLVPDDLTVPHGGE